jgi:hypothetical protein
MGSGQFRRAWRRHQNEWWMNKKFVNGSAAINTVPAKCLIFRPPGWPHPVGGIIFIISMALILLSTLR